MKLCLIVLSLLHCYSFITASLPTDQFSGELRRLANDILGVINYHNYQNNLNQRSSNLYSINGIPDGQKLAAQLSDDIEKIVGQVNQAVINLRNAVLSQYNLPTTMKSRITNCCEYRDAKMRQTLFYNQNFRQLVDVNSFCHVSPPSMNSDVSYNKSSLMTTYLDNANKVPFVESQYYGEANGNFLTYPTEIFCPDSYDPRIRPWYTDAAGSPKDIIFIIDKSTWMGDQCRSSGNKKIEFAKNITIQMMKYLSGNDRVAVLAMDGSTFTANSFSCFNTELATGNQDNLNNLLSFVQGLSPNTNNNANFTRAFLKSSQIFDNTRANPSAGMFSNNKQVIVLLTNDRPVDRINDVIQFESMLFNDTVDVFVFDICPDSPVASKNGPVSLISGNGTGFAIQSNADIQASIDSFVNAYAKINTDVTYSIPYMDASGLGLITTASLPVMVNGELKGVVGVDITIDSIFESLVDFRIGRYSYSFVIDGRGRVMLHPLLPQPTTWPELPIFLDLQAVEFDFSPELKTEILSGQPGNITKSLKWFLPNGVSELEGVSRKDMRATYFWNSIPSMKFYFCLVIMENEVINTFSGTVIPTEFLLSDEFNADLSSTGKCNHYGQQTDLSESVVKVSPFGLVNKYNYIERNLTSFDISQLKHILEGYIIQDHSLDVKPGVTQGVNITDYLNSLWLNTSSEVHVYTLSRFICTKEGLFRQHPVKRIDKNVEATQNDWYRNAVSHAGLITGNIPTLDSSGNPQIIFSQTVSINASNDISGVMGIAISYSYVHDYILNNVVGCNDLQTECFVIDSSGFLITHKSFLDNPPQNKVHLVSVEPEVTNDLFVAGFFVQDLCLKYVDVTEQLFWQLNTPTRTMSAGNTFIYTVDGTNVFVIVKTQHVGQRCRCGNSTSNGSPDYSSNCASVDIADQCQCPCSLPLPLYDRCSGNIAIDVWKPCFPPITSNSIQSTQTDLQTNLPSCIPCQLFRRSRDCKSNGCHWNEDDKSCSTEPATSRTSSSPSSVVGLAVGLAIGLTAAVIIVLLIVAILFRKFRKGSDAPTPPKPRDRTTVFITTVVVNSADDSNRGVIDDKVNPYQELAPSPSSQKLPAQGQQPTSNA